jgi:hypothetical protein
MISDPLLVPASVPGEFPGLAPVPFNSVLSINFFPKKRILLFPIYSLDNKDY